MKCYRFADRVFSADRKLRDLAALDIPTSRSWLEVRTTSFNARRKRVRNWAHRWLNDDGSVSLALARRTDGYLLRFPGACDFLFDSVSRAIIVTPDNGVDDAIVEHLLLDQVLPRVFSHLGDLAVHSSAIAAGDGAAIFLGRSGWGKSTLAGLMHRQGYALLSDDCALLRPQSGWVVALPTYRSMRLWPESLDRVFPSAEVSVASSGAKRRLRIGGDDDSDMPRQVNAIYVLNDPSEQRRAISIEPISPAALCLALIKHAFRLDVADRATATTFFGLCAEVARSVPAFDLSYPRDFARATTLVSTLSRHLARIWQPRGVHDEHSVAPAATAAEARLPS